MKASLSTIIAAVAVSAVVGIAFGFCPAWKAPGWTRLKPCGTSDERFDGVVHSMERNVLRANLVPRAEDRHRGNLNLFLFSVLDATTKTARINCTVEAT